MDSTIVAAFIGVGGTLVGGLGGALLGKWLSRDAAQKAIDLAFPKTIELLAKQQFLEVAAHFRSEFSEEIRLLRERYHEFGQKPDFKTAHDIIRSALVKHELAWLKFREFLTGDKLTRFDWLWYKYSYQNKRYEKFFYGSYPKIFARWEKRFGTFEAENKIRNVAIQRIYNMFKLTEI